MIAIPRTPEELSAVDVDLDAIRRSYLRRAAPAERALDVADLAFLAEEVGCPVESVERLLGELDPVEA